MRSPVWRAACALVVVVAALTVSGCDTDDPTDPPTPRPTSTPLFDSDEEALAAAEEAYGRYVAVTDQIFAEGGAGLERLKTVATGSQLEADNDGLENIATNGFRSVGSTRFSGFELQSVSEERENAVVAYVCDDISEVDVLNSAGVSIVSPERPLRVMYELSFDRASDTNDALLVSLKTPWEGATC